MPAAIVQMGNQLLKVLQISVSYLVVVRLIRGSHRREFLEGPYDGRQANLGPIVGCVGEVHARDDIHKDLDKPSAKQGFDQFLLMRDILR